MRPNVTRWWCLGLLGLHRFHFLRMKGIKKKNTLLYVYHQSVCNNLKHFAGSTFWNWKKKKKEDYGGLTRSLKAVSLNLSWAFEMKLSRFQSVCVPLCAAGQLVFEDFLRTEYSEENLLFWLACEDYKKAASETERAEAAKRIYAEFVEVDAPRQVRLL